MNRQSQKPQVSLSYPLPLWVVAQRTYKYYKKDLKLYMAKRAGSGYSTNPSLPKEYVGKKNNKINKIEKQLEVMRQELIRRGYIP